MPSQRSTTYLPSSLPYLLLPLVALIALLPLLAPGCSCGHDIGFHLQSWLDAAQQLRHGTLYPAWATTPAFNAGEPRFLFYPPLSWMLGALLTIVLPFSAVPAFYTWLVLTGAGISMYAVARRLDIAPAPAFVASVVYLANPYMLFTALERTAFAELLATIWVPWLFLALLRERPTVPSLAWPLALLWLTNAPAAVMSSYAFALIASIRFVLALRSRQQPWQLAANYLAGAALGLTLPAFYLFPAIHEQRFVQITMAVIPTLSISANFLFAHTPDPLHDLVNHQASRLALALLALTAVALVLAWRKATHRRTLGIFLAITALIAFLLQTLSAPIWSHLPELSFLQFPWRLLLLLAPIFALAIGVAISEVATSQRKLIRLAVFPVILVALPLAAHYLYPCDANETPATVASLFHTSHGVTATDEYTPLTADNSFLRSDSPGYWLASDPAAFAPNTTPNPNATAPDTDFGELPPSATLSTPAPRHLTLNPTTPQFLILNLRDYPNWDITNTREDNRYVEHPTHLHRDDGLLAIALRPGRSTLDITWRTGLDRQLGQDLSLSALALFAFCVFRSRRIVA